MIKITKELATIVEIDSRFDVTKFTKFVEAMCMSDADCYYHNNSHVTSFIYIKMPVENIFPYFVSRRVAIGEQLVQGKMCKGSWWHSCTIESTIKAPYEI